MRVEPLRVLLAAVEDERLADEAVGDECAHVAQGGSVTKREAELGLQPLLAGTRGEASRLLEVVGDRLLAEDVFACLDRSRRQLEVRVARRAHVDDIDVIAANEVEMAGRHDGNGEPPGGVIGSAVCGSAMATTRHRGSR